MSAFEPIPPRQHPKPWPSRAKQLATKTLVNSAVAIGALALVAVAFLIAEPEEIPQRNLNPSASTRKTVSLQSPTNRSQRSAFTPTPTQEHGNREPTSDVDISAQGPPGTIEEGAQENNGIDNIGSDITKLDPACAGHCTERQQICFYDCETTAKVDTCLRQCAKTSEQCGTKCKNPQCKSQCRSHELGCNDACGPAWINCRRGCNQHKVDCFQVCKTANPDHFSHRPD